MLIVSSALLWGVQALSARPDSPCRKYYSNSPNLFVHGDCPHTGPSCSPRLSQLQAQAFSVPRSRQRPRCVHSSVYAHCSSGRPRGVGCGLKRGKHTGSPVFQDPALPRAWRRVCVMGGVEGGSQASHAGEEGCGGLVSAIIRRSGWARRLFGDLTCWPHRLLHRGSCLHDAPAGFPKNEHPRVRIRIRPQALGAPHGHWSQVAESRPHSEACPP